MKRLLFIGLVFLTSCSSTKTISINSETVPNEEELVDWAITYQDSVVDFRRDGNRYAEINGNQLIYIDGKDSTKTYQIKAFRTIHTFRKAPIIPSAIFFGVAITYSILLYLFSGMSM